MDLEILREITYEERKTFELNNGSFGFQLSDIVWQERNKIRKVNKIEKSSVSS